MLVREARLRAGLSQAALAERVGRRQQVISRWEQGRSQPSLETLREVARACGLDLDLQLARRDDSYAPLVEQRLALTPAERVAAMQQRTEFKRRMRQAQARGGRM